MAYPSPSVEAKSLSDITQLASHPPKYPRNPTEQPREPLTLYIARVPGSRDIILTPLKPDLKNVAAQDVTSSLYYLHFNSEDDARLLEDDPTTIHEEFDHQPGASNSAQKPLARKPLPETARASLDMPADAALRPTNPPFSSLNIRNEPTSMAPPLQDSALVNEPIQRRPLGPRTLPPSLSVARKPLVVPEDGTKTSHYPVPNPRASNDTPRSPMSQLPGLGNPDSAQDSRDAFSITLIRREPGSGAQWNIGTITGHPVRNQSPDRRLKSQKPYFDISVDLTSPGYTPFRYSQPVSRPSRDLPVTGQQLPTTNRSEPQDYSATIPCFHRQVFMEGSNPWDRSTVKHGGTSSEISGRRGRSYSGSSAIAPSHVQQTGQGEEVLQGVPQPKGYVFISPWGGRAKFSTGSGGRTLRCKHTLPNLSSATNSTPSQQTSTLVSELRFNLPSSHLFGSSRSPERSQERGTDFKTATITKLKHIRNKLSSEIREHRMAHAGIHSDNAEHPPELPPRPNQRLATSSSDSVDAVHHHRDHPDWASPSPPREEDSRLDLSLGQEKAGGGNRGKRAKLGKLIICDEGFKMLDLLVAANMGIWWSVWDADP